ncbi:MAG: ABC transporter ATP-binding protein [Planctomycetes bacterium]|nr:ABC transporter ATP-binding protein [Planctomycetota bacterium]
MTLSTPRPPLSGGLHVRDLHKHFPTPGEPLEVLRGVTFDAAPGESAAILGPSGSGKSTLLNILAALETPTHGEVTLDGVNPFALGGGDLAAFRGRRIGMVFQDHHLLGACTALENLLIAPLALGAVRPHHRRRADDLLDRVGLADRAGHRPGELSGGERQRVALARALMNGPSLLLCDEPTGNLDERTAANVTDLLLTVAGEAGATVLLVTHDTAMAARLHRRLRLSDGALIEEAP